MMYDSIEIINFIPKAKEMIDELSKLETREEIIERLKEMSAENEDNKI